MADYQVEGDIVVGGMESSHGHIDKGLKGFLRWLKADLFERDIAQVQCSVGRGWHGGSEAPQRSVGGRFE